MYTLLNKNLCSYIYNNKIDFTNRATIFFPGNSNINEVLKFTTKIITFNYHLQIKYKKIKLLKINIKMKQIMHYTTGGAEWIQNSVKKAFFYKGSDSPNA